MTHYRYAQHPALPGLTHFDDWPAESKHQIRFNRLCEIAPGLRGVHRRIPRRPIHPYPLSDSLFVSLCAAFGDPQKREILRTLILDLMADDLAALLKDVKSEAW